MLESPAHGARATDEPTPAEIKRAHRAQQGIDQLMKALDVLDFSPGTVHEIVTLQDEKRRSVYRVHTKGRPYDALIAKRAPTVEARREVPFYAEVLPALDLPALAMYGSAEDRGREETWLFIEDAAGEPYDRNDRGHCRLAGSWMGRFHAAGATTPLPHLALRDRGPLHFGDHVVIARRELEENRSNDALRPENLEMLGELLRLVRTVDDKWADIVRFMSQFPATFVHGDFKPDNLRIRADGGRVDLVVFDWNEAGRGVPSLDWSRFQVSANSTGSTTGSAPRDGAPSIHRLAPDLDAYLDAVCSVWPQLDSATVHRLGLFGELFHCVASIRWESARLAYSWVETPVVNLEFYRVWLEELMAEVEL
jgi:aminoglycoside phosphotransferase (APT) family kinase protein